MIRLRPLATLGLAVVGGLGLAACGAILGVESIDIVATGDARSPGPSAAACTFAAECPALALEPAGCAAAACNDGVCVYRAVDQDQDGHATARCASKDGVAVALGDDCDDANSQLYPGHPAECAETESGAAIAFPNGSPVGACKSGSRSCNSDGSATICAGAVGPRPVAACTPEDEGCTGNAAEGCACTTGQTMPCGASAVGACKMGTASCTDANVFGACQGATSPAARDCSSAADNDCNGTPDNAETACQCPGGGAPTTSRTCNTHPQDGVGACKAGTQTCVPSGSTSSWGACSGDIAPATELCDTVDRNCNGVPGVNEPAPPPPAGTLNCTHIFACPAPGRGALFFRTGVGFTNTAGGGTQWTAYAPQGDFSDGTFPPGEVRISRDATGTKLGPVSVTTVCCSGGCPTGSTFFDGNGQFYTPAP